MTALPRRGLVRMLGVPLLLAAVATAAAPGLITVHRGETLSELALDHHTTVTALRELNQIPGNGDLIYPGQQIRLPRTGTTTADAGYRVAQGDTLIGIARRFGVSPDAIAAGNHLAAGRAVYAGSTLVIPAAQRAAARPAAAPPAGHYPNAVVRQAAADRAGLARRSLPSEQAVQALITLTARDQHLDPALALAVAYQRSGFQAGVVSPADAIGPMQVLPATGRWMSGVLGQRLDLLDTADNVLAGVTLLRLLTRVAPVDQAVAGYYQGLASVRANGMLPDTASYVANVLRLRGQFASARR